MLICALQEGDPGYLSELKQLQEDGAMSIDDLLASLPPEMLEESRPLTPESEEEAKEEESEEKVTEQSRARMLRKRKHPPSKGESPSHGGGKRT